MAKFVQMIVTSMVGCAFDHGRRDAPYGKSICNNVCSVLVNRIWPRCLKGKAKIGWWRKRSRRARHCESGLRMTSHDGWSSNVIISQNSMSSMDCVNFVPAKIVRKPSI